MPTDWLHTFDVLSKEFPLKPLDTEDPSLALAIDEGVDDLLRDANAGIDDAANPLYVESLLQDCINRISNCLLLRDKAQEIEERAVYDAQAYRSQLASLEIQASIAELFDPVNSKMGGNALSVDTTSGKSVFNGADDIWRDASVKRKELEALTRERLEADKTKSSAAGNASNYVERFAFLKQVFDLNLVEAYRRCYVAAKAAKEIYSIDVPLPKIEPIGYLNKLVIWAQKASDLLDRELEDRYIGKVAFALGGADDALKPNELMTRAAFNAAIPGLKFDFKVLSVHFEQAGMRDVLLRTVRVHVEGKDALRTRIWPALLTLPHSAVVGRSEKFSTTASSTISDTPDSEALVQGVHNIKPLGDWKLELSARAITGEATTAEELKNAYLFLTVSYRRQ